MKLTLDTDARTLTCDNGDATETLPLYSDRAFEMLSEQWLKVGWNQRYSYNFTWLGRPIIQLPEDVLRIQEVLFAVQPDVVIETGVAHGGSLVLYASILHAIGRGRVIGVDIEIRPMNRQAIEQHPMSRYIDLIEGSSTAPETVDAVRSRIKPGERVLILLDSNHTRQHVADELEAYAPMVTPGSYLVATDGIMKDLHDVPGGKPEWTTDHPTAAAADFAAAHPEFVLEQPRWPFRESTLEKNLTYWPGAYLRKL